MALLERLLFLCEGLLLKTSPFGLDSVTLALASAAPMGCLLRRKLLMPLLRIFSLRSSGEY